MIEACTEPAILNDNSDIKYLAAVIHEHISVIDRRGDL